MTLEQYGLNLFVVTFYPFPQANEYVDSSCVVYVSSDLLVVLLSKLYSLWQVTELVPLCLLCGF